MNRRGVDVEGLGPAGDSADRLTLSRDLDLLADRIAVQGEPRRAHELKLVAAMLRDKAARPVPDPVPPDRPDPAPAARHPLDDYLLAASLFVGWLIVVLALVTLAAAALGATPTR
jgi:hypothetical protein